MRIEDRTKIHGVGAVTHPTEKFRTLRMEMAIFVFAKERLTAETVDVEPATVKVDPGLMRSIHSTLR